MELCSSIAVLHHVVWGDVLDGGSREPLDSVTVGVGASMSL